MNNYLDILMRNHDLNSDKSISSDIEVNQTGGDVFRKHTGSFPPIYIVNRKEKIDNSDDKIRGYSKINKTAVSIKEIMKERRNANKPFITLGN